MPRSPSLTRPRRSLKRRLAVESLSERFVFSTYAFPVEGISPEAIELSMNTGTSGTLQVPPIVLTLGTLEPGEYSFTFNINLNITVEGERPAAQPPTVPQPPSTEKPATDVPAPVELQYLGEEFYEESFDGGKVADFWTEFTPLAPTEFVGPEGDKEFQISHVKSEDRVVLRKELASFNSIYASYETTFESGFEEQEWWSLKQARLYDETGDFDGTFDFAIWGIKDDVDSSPFISYVYQATGFGDQVPFKMPTPAAPVRVSFYVEQNSPGAADGRFMLWRNEELLIDDHAALLSTKPGGGPSGISFINNYSGGRLGDPSPALRRSFDDILFLTDPRVEPELLHELALTHLGR